MAGEQLTWALLAPVPRDRLEALAKEYWREEVRDDDADYNAEGWEVVGGTRDYSAILDRNPGSEYTHESALAERLSRRLKRPVYVLYLNERFGGSEPVAVYEGGRQMSQRPLPYDLARSLGVALPGDEQDTGLRPARRQVRGVLVVEGVSAAEVAHALDMNEPPRGPVHIEDGRIGAILYNEASEYVPPFTRRLSKAFPEKNVYTISTGPRKGRFSTRVTRGGEDVGTYESPVQAGAETATALDSVKGESTPRGIAAALGVPAGLMDLP